MKCDICNLEKEKQVLKFDNNELLALPCRMYNDDKNNYKFTIAVKKVKCICHVCLFKATNEMEKIMLSKGYTGPFDTSNGFEAFTFL